MTITKCTMSNRRTESYTSPMNSDISVIRDAADLALQCRDFADTEVLGSVGSTNQYLLDQRPAGLSRPRFVWTHVQTHGRGRRGRVWVGPPQHSLMFSMQFLREIRSQSGTQPRVALTGLTIAEQFRDEGRDVLAAVFLP